MYIHSMAQSASECCSTSSSVCTYISMRSQHLPSQDASTSGVHNFVPSYLPALLHCTTLYCFTALSTFLHCFTALHCVPPYLPAVHNFVPSYLPALLHCTTLHCFTALRTWVSGATSGVHGARSGVQDWVPGATPRKCEGKLAPQAPQ
eukprot:gene22274-biopygen11728